MEEVIIEVITRETLLEWLLGLPPGAKLKTTDSSYYEAYINYLLRTEPDEQGYYHLAHVVARP